MMILCELKINFLFSGHDLPGSLNLPPLLLALHTAAAAAKSLQSCPTLYDPIDGSPPGSPVPGILQARTLEWVAISFSNAWKWRVKVKSCSRVRLSATPGTAAWSISNHSPIRPATAATTASRLMRFITKTVDVFIGQDSRSLDSLFPTFNNSRGWWKREN